MKKKTTQQEEQKRAVARDAQKAVPKVSKDAKTEVADDERLRARRKEIIERINRSLGEDANTVTSDEWLKKTDELDGVTVSGILSSLRTDITVALREGKRYLLKGFGAFEVQKDENGKIQYRFTPTKSFGALVKFD